jgi:hypothetical protein
LLQTSVCGETRSLIRERKVRRRKSNTFLESSGSFSLFTNTRLSMI